MKNLTMLRRKRQIQGRTPRKITQPEKMVFPVQGVTQENVPQNTQLHGNYIENGAGKTFLGTYQRSSSKDSPGTEGPNKRTNQSSFSLESTKEKIMNSKTNQSSFITDPSNQKKNGHKKEPTRVVILWFQRTI